VPNNLPMNVVIAMAKAPEKTTRKAGVRGVTPDRSWASAHHVRSQRAAIECDREML
jgi:hypothetical protein